MTNYREIISLHTQLADSTYAFDACARNIGLCPHKQNHPLGGWMLFAPAAKKEEKTRNIFADFPLQ